MAELIGKAIQELGNTPALFDSTCFAVQREGSSRIEKAKLGVITEHITTSNTFKTALKETINQTGGGDITSHISANDPHGDRNYTDVIINSHLSADDPHGDKRYTDNKLNEHCEAEDPHGMQAAFDAALTTHNESNDPHGDRNYTNKAIEEHNEALDPHGDRGYALNLVMEHDVQEDPHGLKSLIYNEINNHQNESNPHQLYEKISELLEVHNNDEKAHAALIHKVNDINYIVSTELSTMISSKLGTVLPYLENGIIPKEFIKQTLTVASQAELPSIGEKGVLYVNTTSKSLSIWDDSGYIIIGGANGQGTIGLTTDSVAPSGNINRQYFTQDDKNALNRKFESINTDDSGYLLYNDILTKDGIVYLKSLKSEGTVQIIEEGTQLTLKTDDYTYKATYNEDVLLTADTDILENIDYNDLVVLKGIVTATNYKAAGDMRLVNYLNRWEVNAVLATQGTSSPIRKPSGIVISSNGLVITGITDPTQKVEVYSMSNDLIGEGTSLTEGSFTVVLNSPELSGNRLKLYTVTPEGNRSEPTYFFSNNTTEIKEITSISFNKTGTKIRGITSRGATVKITDSTQTELGSGIADDFGNFDIPLNKALISNDTIRLTAKLGTTLTTTTDEYIVNIKDIEAPYNITYNTERTVFKGYAEPNATLSFRYNDREFKTTTDSTGSWTLFSFSIPILTNSDIIFVIKQEERSATTAKSLGETYTSSSLEPLVKEAVNDFETKFLIKTITPILGSEVNAGLDLVFNQVTRNLEIHGKNKDEQQVVWLGQFNIIKDSLALPTEVSASPIEGEENV